MSGKGSGTRDPDVGDQGPGTRDPGPGTRDQGPDREPILGSAAATERSPGPRSPVPGTSSSFTNTQYPIPDTSSSLPSPRSRVPGPRSPVPFHLILPAAGLGTRLGGEPKVWRELAGRPVLEWVVKRLLRLGPAGVVVALEPERAAAARPEWLPSAVRIVAGGADRAASVANALATIEGEPGDLVAVHDAARPAVALADFEAVLRAGAADGAAILGRRVTDTVKRIDAGRVVATVDRSSLGRAETPQVARLDLLRIALLPQEPGSRIPDPPLLATDESSALEALGIPVAWVEATGTNPKLTVPADLPVLELLLRGLEHEIRDRERIPS